MMGKPASPAIQTGHAFYANLAGIWLWQNNYNDLFGSKHFSVSGGTDITFATPGGDDDPLLDRSSALNANRLTQASGVTVGGTVPYTIGFRISVRGTAGFGNVYSSAGGGGTGIYTIPSGAGYKFNYYNSGGASLTSSTVLTFNTPYDVVWTYLNTGTVSKFYINGTLDGTSTSATYGSHTLNAMLSDTSLERCNCQIAFLYAWTSRIFDATEAATLSGDRYGLVTPASGSGSLTRGKLTSSVLVGGKLAI